MFKSRFAKHLNGLLTDIKPEEIDKHISDVLEEVTANVHPIILNCTRKYIEKV